MPGKPRNQSSTATALASQPTDLRHGLPTHIVILTDIGEAQRVHQLIMDQLETTHFSERELFGIRLSLEEALINALKHGNRMDPTKKVDISFTVEGDSFSVRVADEGEGFDPDEVPDPTLEENLERPSGRGLMLMRHYMDEVQFLGKGNIVVMTKRCSQRNGSR